MKGFERTLLILKPDAVERRLVGRILARIEEKGLTLAALKLLRVPGALAARHYAEHKDKPFYQGLIRFFVSGPVVLAVAEGKDAVAVCRVLAGATCGREAAPGTIRGDYGMSNRFNLIHASDSKRSARREIALFFSRKELLARTPADLGLLYDLSEPEPL
ncbi:MAG: nucleoside-diphosphate kinase [Planctomycetota bacterium]